MIVESEVSSEETQHYIDFLEKKFSRRLDTLKVEADGEYVDLTYTFEKIPFNRIRRITGYLVGDTTGWNDAKQAELKDRVTHGTNNMEQI